LKLFSAAYERAMIWAVHRRAPSFLAALSFSESCVLPFPPPDVMLAPMALANTRRAWFFAALTTTFSVLGGLAGYCIGYFAFEWIAPLLKSAGYMGKYQKAADMFNEYGVWVVFLAGFSPIPYKVFTIAGGVAHMALLPFVLASVIGRGLRFFIVAGVMVLGGEKMEKVLHKHMDRIGWATVVVIVLGLGVYKIVQHA